MEVRAFSFRQYTIIYFRFTRGPSLRIKLFYAHSRNLRRSSQFSRRSEFIRNVSFTYKPFHRLQTDCPLSSRPHPVSTSRSLSVARAVAAKHEASSNIQTGSRPVAGTEQATPLRLSATDTPCPVSTRTRALGTSEIRETAGPAGEHSTPPMSSKNIQQCAKHGSSCGTRMHITKIADTRKCNQQKSRNSNHPGP